MSDLAAVVTVLVILLAVIRYGAGPERLGGQIMLIVICFGVIRGKLAQTPVDDFDVLGLAADCFAFLGFLWIALFAWRFWPIWTAALQLLAIGAHFGPALQLPVAPIVYAVMRSTPTIVAILTLAGATYWHLRKGPSSANSPPWRTWSGHLNRISPIRLQKNYWNNLGP